jgi:nicotinamidase-related amidase
VPVDRAALLDPTHTAVVTSECQNGVIGPDAVFPDLAVAAADTVIPNGPRVCAAARAAGAAVVHCTAGRRADDRGSNDNARLFGAVRRAPRMQLGTAATDVLADFEVASGDVVLSRIHGLNPMAGTDLDPILRNLGVSTIVVVGVSVNVAVTNLVMDAVNHGYQAVLVRDAVAGFPPSYADAVMEHTLSLLATIVTTDELVSAWASPSGPSQ